MVVAFIMSLRLKDAFAQHALAYWRDHPQEWNDTWAGRDLWDGTWWTLATQRMGEEFWPWFYQTPLDTHLRDQMWALIKETDPVLFRQQYDSPPVQRHHRRAQRQWQDGLGGTVVAGEEGISNTPQEDRVRVRPMATAL